MKKELLEFIESVIGLVIRLLIFYAVANIYLNCFCDSIEHRIDFIALCVVSLFFWVYDSYKGGN